jgi:hypothetical protein
LGIVLRGLWLARGLKRLKGNSRGLGRRISGEMSLWVRRHGWLLSYGLRLGAYGPWEPMGCRVRNEIVGMAALDKDG